MDMEQKNKLLHTVWFWSLFFLLIAALTGLLYRWGLITGDTFGLRLSNVRHAHSHLMFFNWVTPVPMVFIARHLLQNSPESYRALKWCISVIILTGFISFPFFLLFGYHPVAVGGTSLPFSVILSGLVMIGWYWFIAIYLRYRKTTPKSYARLFFDGALAMLFVSSLGAWGVAVTQFGNLDNHLIAGALTHFFLTVFTEGWCIIAAIGILYEANEVKISPPFDKNWLIAPIVLGVPLMFPFGLPAELLSNQLLWVARFGSLLVAAGLILNGYLLVKSRPEKLKWVWTAVLILFGLKILFQIGAALLPSVLWLGEHGLRILYLHLMLLGFVSTLFFTAYHTLFQNRSRTGLYLFMISVLVLICTLVLISGIWPPAWQPSHLYQWVTLGALLPSLAITVELIIVMKSYLSGLK